MQLFVNFKKIIMIMQQHLDIVPRMFLSGIEFVVEFMILWLKSKLLSPIRKIHQMNISELLFGHSIRGPHQYNLKNSFLVKSIIL